MRGRLSIDGRPEACALALWLVLAVALAAGSLQGPGQYVTVGALAISTLAGFLRADWREALAVGLAGAAVAAWSVSGEPVEETSLVVACGTIMSALLAAWARPQSLQTPVADSAVDRQAPPAHAGSRLPPGVADEPLFERLAVHEMTRARRYERPLVLLLIGIDGWSVLAAERGRRGATDQLAALATRIRRLLRDVDAIGVRGDGLLAVLLPETPLDGGLVVAGRIEQTALQDVGVRTRIGAAIFPDDAGTVEALLREAEAGLDLARIERIGIVERVRLA